MQLITGTIIYPSSDGQPMADSTIQYQWITAIKGGCDAIFKDDENVFVAGDLLWYPVEGESCRGNPWVVAPTRSPVSKSRNLIRSCFPLTGRNPLSLCDRP